MAKSKSTKESKHDLSEKKTPSYKFFNNTDANNLRRRIVKELNHYAELHNVDKINLKTDPDYPEDFAVQDWSWRPRFFIHYLTEYERCKGSAPFERAWLDLLVSQCGIMVWNLTEKSMKEEYKKTNIVPENPLSRKQGRNSIEAVAEYYANQAEKEFEEKFK